MDITMFFAGAAISFSLFNLVLTTVSFWYIYRHLLRPKLKSDAPKRIDIRPDANAILTSFLIFMGDLVEDQDPMQ